MNQIEELKNTVIDNGFCIGCGACVLTSKEKLSIKKNIYGKLEVEVKNLDFDTVDSQCLDVCPFYNSEYSEDVIANELFSNIKNIKYDDYIGYNIVNYAGFVKKNDYRLKGSSGGFGTWIASKMLEDHLVDKVIHVKSCNDNDTLFKYQISSNVSEVQEGAKSKYYPIEMSEVLDYVLKNDFKYLFVGIPCFVKAVRQLQKKYPVIGDRIVYTLGLVCGHLKSDYFAKTLGWNLGIHPNNLKGIDFRVKNNDNPANNYNVKAKGIIKTELVELESPMKDLFASNWGYGLFKYKACDYCDDVMAETADVTIGDAWLPEYNMDSLGTNVVTVRNEVVNNLILKYKDEICVDNISNHKVYQSQSGGFRHRREGLQYRLFLLDQLKVWRPIKRFKATNDIPDNRKKIYETRLALVDKSFVAYKNALEKSNYKIFEDDLRKLVKINNNLYRQNTLIYYIKTFIHKLKNSITKKSS